MKLKRQVTSGKTTDMTGGGKTVLVRGFTVLKTKGGGRTLISEGGRRFPRGEKIPRTGIKLLIGWRRRGGGKKKNSNFVIVGETGSIQLKKNATLKKKNQCKL